MLQFGKDVQKSLGVTQIRIPIPYLSYIVTQPEVVRSEVPFLIGIDVLDREGIMGDNIRNVLECKAKG